jgi:hypothetical protein
MTSVSSDGVKDPEEILAVELVKNVGQSPGAEPNLVDRHGNHADHFMVSR